MENDTHRPSRDTPNISDISFDEDDQTPNPTEGRINISFLCNPNDEELDLRQPSTSQLFGNDFSSVQKRSWAKDSTCEQVPCININIII